MVEAALNKILEDHDIQPSAHRLAVAAFVLDNTSHPSADEVWTGVSATFPMISRATVYNTLNLFVRNGLVSELHLSEGKVVFDPNIGRHHHFIDEETGAIHDIPWEQIQVCNIESLKNFVVSDYQVVVRGKRRRRART